MTELTPADHTRFDLPAGGRWFKGKGSQQPMLDIYNTQGGIALACDMASKNSGNIVKMYGIYTDINKEELMRRILQLQVKHRTLYELIPATARCRGYADIDFEGPPDPTHEMFKSIVNNVRSKVFAEYGIEAEIFACCGSRLKRIEGPDGSSSQTVIKHSYHIVISNLIFANNHCPEIKRLFHTDNERFYWMDKGERKCMIDQRVYTMNRVLRLPYCCKHGSQHPLVPIDEDGDVIDFSQHPGRDAEAACLFFVSNPTIDASVKFVPTRASGGASAPSAARSSASKRLRSGEHSNAPPQTAALTRPFPVPIPIVKQLLELAGDSVTTLTNIQYLEEENAWKIQGDQQKQTRTCFVNPSITHNSNNILLFVSVFDKGFRVQVFCTASECSTVQKPILGYITIDTSTYQWQVALSPQYQRMSAEPMIEDGVDLMDDEVPAPGPQTTTDQAEAVDQAMTDMSPSAPAANGAQADVVEAPYDPENPEMNSYALQKERFEATCFKICNPFQFAVILKDGTMHFLKHTSLTAYFSDKFYYQPETGEKEASWKLFIHQWLKDPSKREYLGLVVDPTNAPSDYFNMWKGFLAEKLPPVREADVPALVQPIVDHLHTVITAENEEHTNWLLKWFANQVQRPEQKTGVAVVVYGKEGVGKDIIPVFHRKSVLGPACSYQTANLEHDILAKHAEGAVNRVFIQADEVNCYSHEMRERIKDLITSETINYEPKFMGRMTVNNIVNLYLTTNHENALTPGPTDRRFVLFRSNPVYMGNKQYFDTLGAELAKPEVARAWYQYLMGLDLSEFRHNFQINRPVTDYYKEAQLSAIPGISRFLSAIVNTYGGEAPLKFPSTLVLVEAKDNSIVITAKMIYGMYQNFHNEGNYKNLQTQHSFGREIKRVNGVTKRLTRVGYHYTLDFALIRQHLIDCKEFDEDAVIDA